jgi:acetylglutamate kinase
MKKVTVIKIGGNIIDDDQKLSAFLQEFSRVNSKKVLVHGGGKLATKLASQLGIEQRMVDGRRLTDEQTLRVVTMVYAGYINKNIVAQLQSKGSNAVGICGADGDSITAHKRLKGQIDYGFAGDIDKINSDFIGHLLERGNDIVFAPITHDKKGQLLNTNADTIAQEIATAMSETYDVTLVFGFEKAGVLLDAEDDDTVIPAIDQASYAKLKADNIIFAGMIPKLDNAFSAIDRGVKKVIIGKAENIIELIEGTKGTSIIKS